MKKKLSVLVLLLTIAGVSGCTSLKGNVPFQYQPSLVNSTKTVEKSIGFNILADERPEKDVKSTKKTIKDVPNKITYKIMEDFKSSDIFTDVNFPSKPSDDLIIDGTINRFYWKIKPKFTAFIPYLPLFGVPVQDVIGEADITLVIKDKVTGDVVATINGASSEKLSYTLYNFSVGEAGSELAEALRESVKQLKEKILTEVDF